MKTSAKFLYGMLILGWFTSGVALSEEAGTDPQVPIARIQGNSVTLADLDPDPRIFAQWEESLTEDERARQLNNYRHARLASLVWKPLFRDTLEAGDLVPTEEEIDTFVANAEEILDSSQVERDMERRQLFAELMMPDVSEARKREISERLEILNTLKTYDRRKDSGLEDNPKAQEHRREVGRQGAAWMIERWKFNKIMFDRYGGKVIFQEMGWEPVTAYLKFLEAEENSGTFEIMDPEFREQFYAYYRLPHRYVAPQDAEFYFSKPFWERTREELIRHGLFSKSLQPDHP